jgi:choline monooxygenase
MNIDPAALGHNKPLAFGLPAAWYHSSETYEQERHRVFAREWLWIGRESQLKSPGDYVASEIAGYRVFAIRDREGTLRAFHNVCRHRASTVVEKDEGHCDVLRCRYHGWVYDTAGNLRRTPNFGEAADFRKEDYGLHRISIAVWRGMLFVNLDADAGPLEAGLGDLVRETSAYPIEDYRFVHQEVFDMNCNWKTYTDNFVEGYHVPGIHPPFAAVIDFERFTTEGRNRTVIMQAPQKDGSFYGGLWLWRYPNTTLSVFPGGMSMSRIIPLGTRRTRLVYNFFFADDSPAAAAKNRDTIERNCQVVREDFGICETSQGNLESGIFDRGPLSPRHEEGVRHFHDLLRESLAQGPGAGG